MNTDTLYPVQPDFASDKILSARLKRLEEVLSEDARHREELETRHPWVPIITRWIIALLLIILAVYFIVAGIQAGIGKRDEKLIAMAKTEAVDSYKAEQKQAEEEAYEQSEEKRKADKREADSILLAKDSGVWKNEAAFKTHCWNVIIRTKRPDYPNEIADVLAEPKQYEYSNPDSETFQTQKKQWALEVLEQAETGELPLYLTLDHQFEEMRNGGNDCVLNTVYKGGPGNDPWRYRE